MVGLHSLIPGLARAVETLDGPFYEPHRAYPAVTLADAVAALDALEFLFRRLAKARAWSLVYAPVLGAVLALLPIVGYRPGMRLLAFGIGVVAGLWDFTIGTSAPYSARSVTRMIMVVLGPSFAQVRAAALTFHDAVIGLREDERLQLLGGLTSSGHSLVVAAIESSWTLVPSSMRDQVE